MAGLPCSHFFLSCCFPITMWMFVQCCLCILVFYIHLLFLKSVFIISKSLHPSWIEALWSLPICLTCFFPPTSLQVWSGKLCCLVAKAVPVVRCFFNVWLHALFHYVLFGLSRRCLQCDIRNDCAKLQRNLDSSFRFLMSFLLTLPERIIHIKSTVSWTSTHIIIAFLWVLFIPLPPGLKRIAMSSQCILHVLCCTGFHQGYTRT